MKASSKDNKWQIIRGISVIFVILIHVQTAAPYRSGSFDHISWVVLRQIINCAVPLFFFMSGFFTKEEYFRDGKSMIAYWKTKGLRLIVPFLIWSFVYSIVGIITSGSALSFGMAAKWAAKMLSGQAEQQLYFVFVLIQLKLLTPLLIRVRRSAAAKAVTGIIFALWIGAYYISRLGIVRLPDFFSFKIVFLSWMPYYILGMAARERRNAAPRPKTAVLAALTLAAFMLALCEDFFWYKEGMDVSFQVSQMKLTNYAYGVLACLTAFAAVRGSKKAASGPLSRALTALGNDSYGIFYVHCLFVPAVDRLLSLIGFNAPEVTFPLIAIIKLVSVLLLSVLLVRLVKLAAKRTKLPDLLGFN